MNSNRLSVKTARPLRAGWLATALLASLGALAGCDDAAPDPARKQVPAVAPGGGAAPDFDATKLKADVVQPTQEQSDAVDVQPDKLVFPASAAAEVIKQWPAGAPVLGNRRSPGSGGNNVFGYLRRVKEVKTEGGNVVVMTEPATLQDVVEGDAQLTADPHAAIPIDTTGVDLSQYFAAVPGGAPEELPATDADAGAGDAGADGAAPPTAIRPTGPASRLLPYPSLYAPEGPTGSVQQAGIGSFVSGAWSDVKQGASDVGSAVSDTASAAASLGAGLPGVSKAVDVSTFFNVKGPLKVFDLKSKKKTFKNKKGVAITVEITGTAALTGTVTYNPTFHLGATVGVAGVQQFSASATGDLAIVNSLDVTTNVTVASGTKPTDAVDLAELLASGPEVGEVKPVLLLQSPPFAGPAIAGIPTTFVMELWGDCNFGIQGTMQAHADTTLQAPGSRAGVSYSVPVWTPEASFKFKNSSRVSVIGGGGVTVECGLSPRVNWLFADVAGPYVGLRGSVRAHGAYVESCDPKAKTSGPSDGAANLGVDGKAQVTVGGGVKAWGVLDLSVGPYAVYTESFPDLWHQQFSYPKKGIGYCSSTCDDGAQDGAETGLDCGGSICNPCGEGGPCSSGADCATGYCSTGGACVGHCADGVKDSDESDTDCGGSCGPTCWDARACASGADCVGGFCLPSTHLCGSTCADGVQDYGESDVDCGSGCATRCPVGAHCGSGGDCDTGVCNYATGLCIVTPCLDGTKDFGETGVDCGRVCSTLCANGVACQGDPDCASAICNTSGACVATRCQDGVKNGTETGVDCGGGTCSGCGDGAACAGGVDCLSGLCHVYKHFCTSDPCNDGVKDGDETGFDCGGSKCGPCGLGKACGTGADCATGFCATSNTCVESQCRDGRKNGTEVDVDCGGACPIACGQGKACGKASDCLSGLCNAQTGKCIGNRCLDTVKNGDETDLDCGGACPAKCATGKACKIGNDCASGICNAQTETCVATRCQDGVRDDAETAVDCGGGACAACANGAACQIDADCQGICGPLYKTCVTNHCSDQTQDADETALDCGGALCGGCKVGIACVLDRDCASAACGANGKCATNGCSDGRKNGSETAVDCGGTCTGCAVGVACATGNDCGSGSCSASAHTCIAGCTSGADCATGICNVGSGSCVASLCLDGVLDGQETALDCGGGCAGCAVDAACHTASDCASAACSVATNLCVADHCTDGAKSGDETDLDCGGALCGACATGKRCGADGDCVSAACNLVTTTCVATHCADGRKDSDEADTDCGGATCGKCANGLTCAKGADCSSTFCSAYTGRCVADHCTDGVIDGGEGDVDCGFYCPNRCAIGQTCGNWPSCQSNDCKAGYCVAAPAQKTCFDWYNQGRTTNGLYTGFVDYVEQTVYCDMTGGGWMVAFEKDSMSCAYPTINPAGSFPNRDANSHVGDHWGYEYALAQVSPEEHSLPTWNNGACALLTMDLRASVPYGSPPAPAYTQIRFTSYENGALAYTSSPIDRTSLLLEWGVDGEVINGTTAPYRWCRGTKAYTATGACKGSTGLGDGWDFSQSTTPNDGLTMAELFENGSWNINAGAKTYVFENSQEYTPPALIGHPGANQVIWIR